ncbi:MAG: DUF4230 domain-containing protein [Patescibacteria group bacterium]
MKSRIILLWTLIGIAIFYSAGVYTGYKLFSPKPKASQTVSAQAILTALHNRGFLVSQTYVFDTPVTIDRNSGNAFKDFFFGQTIEARGTMEVNLGVDLASMTQQDVVIDPATNTITVTIPKARLFNSRLVGPIELKNNQGVLKQLLNSDDGYNESLSLLSQTAEKAAQTDETINRATDQAKQDIETLLGYVVEGKTVKVMVK